MSRRQIDADGSGMNTRDTIETKPAAPARRASTGDKTPLETQRRGERGAVLVEAAMVTALLLMLLVGTVTAALAYSQKSSLQTAAREASRFAATLPVNGDMTGWLNSVRVVAAGAANGNLDPTIAGQSICVAYVYPNGTAADDRNSRIVQKAGATGTPTYGPTSKCFEDGRPDDERRVQVTVGRKSTIQAVLFSTEVDLGSKSTARFERSS